MERILLSWIATTHDFIRSNGGASINPEGPNFEVHRHFWKYDRHLLLSQKSEQQVDPAMVVMQRGLSKQFPDHVIEPVFMGLEDIISVDEIRSKVEKLVLRHIDDDMDILVSTGTPSMMTAWYFVHFGLRLKTKLFQLRPKKYTKEKKRSEQIFETVEQSTVPSSIALRQTTMEEGSLSSPSFKLTPSIKPTYERARLVSQTDDATCLILGPTGTGKEHLARYIHDNSARKARPFIPVNCSALGSGDLLESRLFGYAADTFTGQKKGGRAGYVEDANGGTLFLDEIGDASEDFQQMLLRVLQEKEVTRVGASKPVSINVRVIAATHRDLLQLCEEGKFRWDLYYRLSLAELSLPSLRERGLTETRTLIDFFLESKRKKYGRNSKLKLSNDSRQILESYPFPGNIRELENLIEHLCIFSNETIEVSDLPSRILRDKGMSFRLDHAERLHIEAVYMYFEYNKKRTALALGVAPNTLKSKLAKYETTTDPM